MAYEMLLCVFYVKFICSVKPTNNGGTLVEICTHLHIRWMYFGGDMYSLAYQVDVLWWRYVLTCISGGCTLVEICTAPAVFWWSYVPTHMSGGCTLVELFT